MPNCEMLAVFHFFGILLRHSQDPLSGAGEGVHFLENCGRFGHIAGVGTPHAVEVGTRPAAQVLATSQLES